jgi:hypothetical protein
MINQYDCAGQPLTLNQYPLSAESSRLTLEKNSVLLLRCSKDYYLDDLNLIQTQVQKAFPNTKVIVLYNDIVPEVIYDKTYRTERPLAEDYDGYYT